MDKTKLAEFWRRNQTLLLILPLTMVFLQLAWMVLQALDPRIGVEGFAAWWIKRHCWFDLHQATELDLFERVRDKNDAAARWLIAKDRIEWAVALAFATWWFTR